MIVVTFAATVDGGVVVSFVEGGVVVSFVEGRVVVSFAASVGGEVAVLFAAMVGVGVVVSFIAGAEDVLGCAGACDPQVSKTMRAMNSKTCPAEDVFRSISNFFYSICLAFHTVIDIDPFIFSLEWQMKQGHMVSMSIDNR